MSSPSPSPPSPPPPTPLLSLLLSPYCTVCFDVDSTCVSSEGIDEIAALFECSKEVAEMTNSAMSRADDFFDSLCKRLRIIEQSYKRQVKENNKTLTWHFTEDGLPALGSHLVSQFKLTDGLLDFLRFLCEVLKKGSDEIFLISGGFEFLVNPIGKMMGIKEDHCVANRLIWNSSEGVRPDESIPTSKSKGKAEAIRRILTEKQRKWRETHREEEKCPTFSCIMIGDGMSDVEAKSDGAASYVIGYGGVVQREKVKEKADFFVENWKSLKDTVEKFINKESE